MPRSLCLLTLPGSSETNQVGRYMELPAIEIIVESRQIRGKKNIYELGRLYFPPRNEITK